MNRLSQKAVPSGRRRWIASALLASAATWLHPAPALAHGSLAIGDFYTGMLHPFLHFETLLPTLALALWSGQLGQPHAWRLPLLYLAAALLGAVAGILEFELQLGTPMLRLSMPILGLLVATRGKLPVVAAIAMALIVGICSGQVNALEPGGRIERPLLFAAGLGSCTGLILYHVVTRVVRYQAFWVQTGVRVLGSWIAAAGLLVLALEWTANG
jgi:urease accessory protein